MTFGRCFTSLVGVVIYPRSRVLHQPAATTDVAMVVFSYAKVPRRAVRELDAPRAWGGL